MNLFYILINLFIFFIFSISYLQKKFSNLLLCFILLIYINLVVIQENFNILCYPNSGIAKTDESLKSLTKAWCSTDGGQILEDNKEEDNINNKNKNNKFECKLGLKTLPKESYHSKSKAWCKDN